MHEVRCRPEWPSCLTRTIETMSPARCIRLFVLCLCAALLLPPRLLASDDVPERDWWGQLKKAASSCFGGRDIKVEFAGGVGSRTLGEVAKSGPFSEFRLSVPLYSRRERQKQKREMGEFLEHAASILRELREAQALIAVKEEKATVLREVMLQEGLGGIESFFQIREEVVVLEEVAAAAKMKLTGHILACGGK